jgi:hypothetical protein
VMLQFVDPNVLIGRRRVTPLHHLAFWQTFRLLNP